MQGGEEGKWTPETKGLFMSLASLIYQATAGCPAVTLPICGIPRTSVWVLQVEDKEGFLEEVELLLGTEE